MSIQEGERLRAERALEDRTAATGSQQREWPSVAGRIRAARARTGLTDTEAARRLGISVAAYDDLEQHDDEAFKAVSLEELVALALLFDVSLRVLLFGADGHSAAPRVTFEEIAASLATKASNSGLSPDQLSQIVGWDIGELLRDPKSFWQLSIEALYDTCKAVHLDWVAALPEPVRSAT